MTQGQNFLDRVRNGEVKHATLVRHLIIAFDPDVDTVGYCIMRGESAKGQFRAVSASVHTVDLGTGKSKIKGQEKQWRMADRLSVELNKIVLDMDRLRQFGVDRTSLFVESQEIYRNKNIDANGILKVAQVAGQLQAIFHSVAAERFCETPKVWKQSKGKEGMHIRAIDRLPDVAGEQNIHNMDAFSMCFYVGDRLAKEDELGAARLTNSQG